MPITSPWKQRVTNEARAGNIAPKEWKALEALANLLETNPNPSHKEIAREAGCGVSTVQRALRQAKHLGLAFWVADYDPAARRGRRQLPNRYELTMPQGPTILGRRLPRPVGQRGPANTSLSDSFLPLGTTREADSAVAAARQALAAVAARRTAALWGAPQQERG
jgi:DNA-binding transcriptional MocR family regulator